MAKFKIDIPCYNIAVAPLSFINEINCTIFDDEAEGSTVTSYAVPDLDYWRVEGDLPQATITLIMALAQGHFEREIRVPVCRMPLDHSV